MTYPENLKIEYPHNYSFKKPILVAFCVDKLIDTGQAVTFFAGLGTPWKTSPSVEFAAIVRNTHQQENYIVGLHKAYGLTFTVMELSDALQHEYSCSICAYSWSILDREYASLNSFAFAALSRLPVGSPFHNCSPEGREEHIQRIAGSQICANESCHSLSCGSEECRITSRGKGAKLCIPCRKAQTTRRNRRGQ